MIATLKLSLHRLLDLSPGSWLVGVALAAAQTVIGDVFTVLLLLVAAATFTDWIFGARAAAAADTYTSKRSNAGWQSKFASVLLLLLVRGFEAWLDWAGYANTHGAGATILAVGYFAADLKSIDRHIQTLGGSGIPLLRQVLDLLMGAVKKLMPGLQSEKR